MAAAREPGLVRAFESCFRGLAAGVQLRHVLLPVPCFYSIGPPNERRQQVVLVILFIVRSSSRRCVRTAESVRISHTGSTQGQGLVGHYPVARHPPRQPRSSATSHALRRKRAACHESFARRSHAPLRMSPRRWAVVSKTIVSSLATFRNSPRGTLAIAPLASR
jgi:hypothetical protein